MTEREKIHSGKIYAFKLGSRWKIPREGVVEFIRFG